MTAFKPGDRVHLKGHPHNPHTTGTVTGTTPEGRVLVRWDDNHAITEQVPHYLTPLGEPMSKTFRSVTQDEVSARTLQVSQFGTTSTISVGIYDGPKLCGIHISAADAPAFALAALEAAPAPEHVRDGSPEAMLAIAQGQLRRAVDAFASDAEAKAREAADREALEGEALALLNAMYGKGRENWNGMSEAKAHWITVAKVARELYGVKA